MGYDPVYGAWPLKRVIQREVRDPLALLRGEFSESDMVQVDVRVESTFVQAVSLSYNPV